MNEQKVRLRFHESPPSKIPPRIRAALADLDEPVSLTITVSEIQGVGGYGFAFGGAPVAMSKGKGACHATIGKKTLLEWVMVGEPGGTMHVTVAQGSKTIAERNKSRITPPGSKGYDALEILIS